METASMRIRYVVSTMIYWWRETNLSLEQECEFLKSLGFGVELWPKIKGQNECRYEKYNWPRLLCATEGMLVSMRSRNDNPTLEQWDEQIGCAEVLGADIVADLQSLAITKQEGSNGRDFAAEVVRLAEEKNVKLCIETGDLSKVRQLGQRFDSLWYCLDTGYANVDRTYSFKEYVDELAGRVAHLHISDNYGLEDNNEPPGLKDGIPRENWDYLLNALSKYDNDLIGSFEMCPSMPAVMIRQASQFLFDELNWPNRPQRQPDAEAVIYKPV
ncbi:sugar phosphate isomerase/epimerase family protein [Planctomycetota bacterium]